MTNKVVLGVIAAFVFLGLIGAAFAGGIVLGMNVQGAQRSVAGEPILNPTTPADDNSPTPSDSDTDEMVDYQLLGEVLSLLKQDFYGKLPDPQTMAYGAIRGMLSTLDDPYTSFIEPKMAAVIKADISGQFEGIGATVRMREDGYLEIVRPLPGHPAEKAGLRSKDIILQVDDQSIVGMGLYEALGLIRGEAGTQVTLEVAREQTDTFTVTITRARIEVPIVESKMLDNGYAYIRLTEFDANARSNVESALKELMAQNPKGLIFDLRDDPGGLLDQAIKVGDLFLDEGLVALERDNQGNEQKFYTDDGDLGEDIPMVVLINGGSASASEIVAGALQDRGRAVLIGEQSLGKGSVQMPHDLSDGSQLRVTIARWFTPNDHSIHGEGLKPDVEVTVPQDNPADKDPQLDRAVQYLEEGK